MTLTYQGKLFAEYPDVVSVKQMCIMLGGISMKTAYKLLGNGEIHHLKIGKSFKIPKISRFETYLRFAAAEKWCTNEGYTGVAWTQQL